MKKGYRVLREILHQYFTKGERFFVQQELAHACGISLGTLNPLIKKLERMRMIECRPFGLRLLDPRRLLVYWAARRDLFEDIVYSTHCVQEADEVERALVEAGFVLTAQSGYKRVFGKTPPDYDKVLVYGQAEKIRRIYGPRELEPNLIVLEPDEHLYRLSEHGVAPLVQLYVDLWQLGKLGGELKEDLERKLEEAPLKALERVR